MRGIRCRNRRTRKHREQGRAKVDAAQVWRESAGSRQGRRTGTQEGDIVPTVNKNTESGIKFQNTPKV